MSVLLGVGLGSVQVAAAAPGDPGASDWVYEALGEHAPRREHFVVRPEAVTWLDPQGRVQWRLDRRDGSLWQADPQQDGERRMDAAARSALAAELVRVQALGQVVRPAAGRPARAFAAVEAADRFTPRPGATQVAGMACRSVDLHRHDQAVGEACIAQTPLPSDAAALLQLLRALLQLADDLAQRTGAGATPAWPLHPLVTATRGGGLPLSVRESPGDRPPSEWRLQAPASPDGPR